MIKNLQTTEDLFKYDILLFDVNGVIKDTSGIIPGTPELLSELVAAKKIVILLSNGTQTSAQAEKSYAKRGFIKGEQYNEFITSGELAHKILSNNELKFISNESPKTYKIFGTPRKELFAESQYQEVESYSEADFAYISIPQLTPEEAEALPSDYIKTHIHPSKAIKGKFDTTESSPFKKELQEIHKNNLPIFLANPDKVANELAEDTGIGHFVIRQGTIGDMYKEMGGEVQEIGKPASEIYKFTLDILQKNYNIDLSKELKILMIGDTLQTDILGAKNATKELGVKIDSLLTLSGVSANNAGLTEEDTEEEFNKKLNIEIKKQNTFPRYIIKTIGK